MGWGHGELDGREVGYAVTAECDNATCTSKIDRGLGYRCGGTLEGCGRYFCGDHLMVGPCDHETMWDDDPFPGRVLGRAIHAWVVSRWRPLQGPVTGDTGRLDNEEDDMDTVVEQALTEARSLIADLASDYGLGYHAFTHVCCEVVTERIDAALEVVRNADSA
jgi:hypothetical protein